jgi:hypothetical protein
MMARRGDCAMKSARRAGLVSAAVPARTGEIATSGRQTERLPLRACGPTSGRRPDTTTVGMVNSSTGTAGRSTGMKWPDLSLARDTREPDDDRARKWWSSAGAQFGCRAVGEAAAAAPLELDSAMGGGNQNSRVECRRPASRSICLRASSQFRAGARGAHQRALVAPAGRQRRRGRRRRKRRPSPGALVRRPGPVRQDGDKDRRRPSRNCSPGSTFAAGPALPATSNNNN